MERELKMALEDPDHLHEILRVLPAPSETTEQRNHYFVDPDQVLARERLMVRVREERLLPALELRWVVLTLKQRLSKVDGVFVAREDEAHLPPEDWADVLEDRRDLLTLTSPCLDQVRSLGVSCLLRHATMVNVRRRIPLDGFILEVDQTTFPNGVIEAEIEVETDRPGPARVLLEAVALDAGVPLHLQTRGKYGRLLGHLNEGAS